MDRNAQPGDAAIDTFGTLPAGARVGRYEIVSVLGRGGFGITYRARDVQLARDVALKEYLPVHFAERHTNQHVLPRSTQVAADFTWGRDRFLNEAKTLARLGGVRGIVAVHDFLKANGTAYMVMALIQGEPLDAILKREQRLPFAALERLIHPLLDGLERVHADGFLHRDIKPGNVIVGVDGQPTLIDFGAARITLHDRTQSLTVIFTPGYAPFEQTSASGQGPWTDIYALAATLYHGITGAPPPNAIERMLGDRMVAAVDAGQRRCPPAFLAAIDAALALKPEDRPQTIAAWRRMLTGEVVATPPTRSLTLPAWQASAGAPPAVPPPAAASPEHGPRRRWPVWAAVGCAAVALLGGGGYLAWSNWTAIRPASQTASPPPRERTQAAQAPAAPMDGATMVLRDQCANMQRVYTSAIVVQACTKLIQSDRQSSSDRARAYSDRGIAYGVMGDHDAAIRDFDAAVRLEAGDPQFYENRARAYASKGQIERAIADYNQAIALDGRDAALLVGRGNIHLQAGNTDLALRDYDQAIKLDPGNAVARYRRGLIFAGRKQFEQAIREYDVAIQSAPNNFDFYTRRAEAHTAIGDLDRALADYDVAVKVEPRDANAYYKRSLLKRRTGDTAGAEADMKQAKLLDPNIK